MHITEKTKEYECCVSCKHNKRKKDGENIYCECEIDGHYIGYIASFDNVCERWVKNNMDYETLRNSMTVQDAIQVLKETNCYGTMDIAKSVILKALDEQMSHSEEPNKWIPISKEVPKEKGEYITTTMYGEVFCDYWDGDRFDRTETVIAWQKLPAPFKPQPNERTEERTEMHACDYISRKAVLESLHRKFADGFDSDRWWNSTVVLYAISETPSVTPQSKTEQGAHVKKGHWIEHKHGGIEHIECSECGIWFLKADLPRKSYCPNCGSCNGDMIKNIMRDIAKTMSGGTK